ncbi:MAG TPA: SUMF1/EgtB/PvdO family nonheme iron enzyme, partial [Rhodanobacteraceae bacterium]|nr:SUMF1/EgtB/PvdO family nonheme iron enzyme [Rhodanobacteraceae bacterium]
ATAAVAPGEPQPPEAPTVDAAAVDAMLAEAKELTDHGHLVTPKGKNAAERYLAALHADPTRQDALRGIEGLFAPLGSSTGAAIDHGDASGASESIEHAVTIADTAKLRKSKAFAAYRTSVHGAIELRRQHGHGVFDAGELAPLTSLVPALNKLDSQDASALQADIDRPAKLLRDGGSFHDAGGPELSVIPARTDLGDHLEYAYALGVNDVTRAAYQRFAKVTGRPPSRCRESQSLFARRDLSWESPGFAQTDDHPVVCITWQDAKAYVDWLSRQTGERYRLPTQQEWMHVAQAIVVASGCGGGNFSVDSCDDGFANTAPVGHFPATRYGLYDVVGNVAVWTGDCAEPSKSAACRAHVIRGLSWRDERDPAQVWRQTSSADDVAYATVGLRVLREISADNARLAKH